MLKNQSIKSNQFFSQQIHTVLRENTQSYSRKIEQANKTIGLKQFSFFYQKYLDFLITVEINQKLKCWRMINVFL